jgi:glucose-1-phosphate adenylyltransferase
MLDLTAVLIETAPPDSLEPLTKGRSAATLPFAGVFRVIDVPLANCAEASLDTIFVLSSGTDPLLRSHLDAITRNAATGLPVRIRHLFRETRKPPEWEGVSGLLVSQRTVIEQSRHGHF